MRLIKFNQEETKKEAYMFFVFVIIVSVLWSIIYNLN